MASHRHQNLFTQEDREKLDKKLSRIKQTVLVLSGKGGVGKSMIAVNLAAALMLSGKRVGLLDIDIHGPSIPTMLGLDTIVVHAEQGELMPVDLDGMKVMSIGFLLPRKQDAVIWRGPMKMGIIKQFITDVTWGDLDFLVVDSPPGTGDEPLSICQLIGKIGGAVIVTTPQKVAALDVLKSITFCQQLGVPVCGVIENMSGFVCPQCGETSNIFRTGGGKQISKKMGVPYLGSIPLDPRIAETCDNDQAFITHYADLPTARIMRTIIQSIEMLDIGETSKSKKHEQ